MDPVDSTNSKTTARPTARSSPHGIAAELVAVLVAVTSGEPRVLTIQDQRALPSGPFELDHRSLQSGMRAWVERQTRLPLGYVEQLYTFADRDRAGVTAKHVISVSYLGLTREQPAAADREDAAARLDGLCVGDAGQGRAAGAPATRRDAVRIRRPCLERGSR